MDRQDSGTITDHYLGREGLFFSSETSSPKPLQTELDWVFQIGVVCFQLHLSTFLQRRAKVLIYRLLGKRMQCFSLSLSLNLLLLLVAYNKFAQSNAKVFCQGFLHSDAKILH